MIKWVCDKCNTETTRGFDSIKIDWSTENPFTKLQTVSKTLKIMLCPACMKGFLTDFASFLENLAGMKNKYRCKKNGQEYFLLEEPEDFDNIGEKFYVVFERKGKHFVKRKEEFDKEFVKSED